MRPLRSLVALSRPAGLPTVWSNCLAGWWLGDGGNSQRLPFLFAGATLIYLGGTWLSDAFANGPRAVPGSQRLPMPERCEPGTARGPAAEGGAALAVQGWGVLLLVLGAAALFWVSTAAGAFGLALAMLIILCHVVRRLAAYSFLLPALCRLLIYLIAASAGMTGPIGGAIWCGLALAMYVLGVEAVPRQEHRAGSARYWPVLLLATPIFLALIMDDGERREAGLLLSAVLALWTVRCLRPALWSQAKDFANAVPGLVAGIVFVDLLAAASAPKGISLAFLLLFGLTRLLQRYRPA